MTIINKKRDNRGITIIHALVCVIIFAVFSSIILAATSSNLRSARAQKNYQQAYVSVSNAVDLFMKSLENDEFVYVRTIEYILDENEQPIESTKTIVPGTWSYEESSDYGPANIFINNDSSKTNFLATFSQAYLGNTTNPLECDIVTTFSDDDDVFTSTVHCKVTILPGGDLIAEFYLPSTGDNNNDNYYMSVELPIEEIDINNDEEAIIKPQIYLTNMITTYTYNIGYNFSEAVISKGEYNFNEEEPTQVFE